MIPDSVIVEYINDSILPMYQEFDGAHNIDHVSKVISNSLEIASDYEVNINMVYIIAAFHDLGLKYGREKHEIRSGEILLSDQKIKSWFLEPDIIIMKEAVEDHRASSSHEPRTIYGKIVSEADREISYENILKRTIQYNLRHSPNSKMDQSFESCYDHIIKKYGEGGYIKLWLKTTQNAENLKDMRMKLTDKENVRKDFEMIYKNI